MNPLIVFMIPCVNRTSFKTGSSNVCLISPHFVFWLCVLSALASCSGNRHELREEQIRIAPALTEIDSVNSIQGNVSFGEMNTYPQDVVLTGLPQHRLVTVYKSRKDDKQDRGRSSYYYYDDYSSDRFQHFMPGIDLLPGYNLLNIAHYDLTTEKLTFLFDQPVLVKSLYYPSFVQDSINKKPVNRDYYMVSVYDTDTNADTLLNKSDLRRFYHFNASCSKKTLLIPNDYSAVRSQYDRDNDIMYIFARHDSNKNGMIEKTEPLHVFWIDLKSPLAAKRLY